MAHIAESVPLGEILKIETYINHGKSLPEILKETGASWALNSIMYNPDGSPCSHLKVDGRVLGQPDYNTWGLAWDQGPDIHLARLPAAGEPDLKEKNYLGGVTVTFDGKAVEKPIYAPAQGGIRGRTAWGLKQGRFATDICSDGSGAACTPEELGERLEDFGWTVGIMGDCGGSSQGVLNGREIRAARKVKYLLLIYLKKDVPPDIFPGSGYEPTVKAYSRSRDGEKSLSRDFKVKEFRCRDGSDPIFVSPGLVQVLQAIRDHFRKPVRITSGYRTPPHNKRSGGKTYSQHLYGLAADITLPGISPAAVGAYARQLMPNHGGVGIYEKKGFTHVDVRKERADWRE